LSYFTQGLKQWYETLKGRVYSCIYRCPDSLRRLQFIDFGPLGDKKNVGLVKQWIVK